MSGTKRWAAGLFIALIFMYNHVGALAQGETSAKAACVLELETGRVLFEQNARARLPMASTTKVMTALLAIENGDLSAPVTCSANAFGVPGTSIYLAEGETLTLEQMLYGLMLASGNDAAVAIAEHIGGSVPQFVQRMNARAAELGAANTHFANPNGLPDDTHVTTAYDLARIARAAMGNDTFRKIVSTQRAEIPWAGRSYNRHLKNKNRLLESYPGATGVKTGYTKAAGRCLVSSAKRDGMELIAVILKGKTSPDRFADAQTLLNYGFASYALKTVIPDEPLPPVPVTLGTQATVQPVLGEENQLLLEKAKTGELSQSVTLESSVQAPVAVGDRLGTLTVTFGEEVLVELPLLAGEEVPRITFRQMLPRVLRIACLVE